MFQTALLPGEVWIYNDIGYKDELNVFWVVTPCRVADTNISEEHSASNFHKRIIYSSTLEAEAARFF